jgi:hypothetical protein
MVKIVLTVAHIDHNPENMAEENLASLCQMHHLRHDAEQHRYNAMLTREKKKRMGSLFDFIQGEKNVITSEN